MCEINPTPYLKAYYETHDEDGRLLSRTGQIEFLTTMRYIEKYLRPGMRILEIGAATGRYSHTLARMGYQVDAIELLEHNIGIFRQNTQPGENLTITQGNAIDLSAFPSATYDITLLLGPCTTFSRRRSSTVPSPRPSGCPGPAAFSSPPTATTRRPSTISASCGDICSIPTSSR